MGPERGREEELKSVREMLRTLAPFTEDEDTSMHQAKPVHNRSLGDCTAPTVAQDSDASANANSASTGFSFVRSQKTPEWIARACSSTAALSAVSILTAVV